MKNRAICASLGVLAFTALAAGNAFAETSACLITKTDTNPFFVKMKEGAEAKAAELGVSLKSYAGKVDGDSESQVAAIETCIVDGAKGILLTASIPKALFQRSHRHVMPVFWSLHWIHRLSQSTQQMPRLQPTTSRLVS